MRKLIFNNTFKRIIYHNEVGLVWGMQNWFNIQNQDYLHYQQKKMKHFVINLQLQEKINKIQHPFNH